MIRTCPEPRPQTHPECFKFKPPDVKSARKALIAAKRNGLPMRTYYFCRLCRAYHLTKMEKR